MSAPPIQNTYRRLLTLARPERRSLLWGLFFLAITSVASLSYPQLIRWMVDHVLSPKRMELLLPTVAGLGALFVVQGLMGSVRYYLFTMSGERIVLGLRRRLFSKILEQEVAFFDTQRTGELMSRLSSDCTTLQNTVSVNISQGLRNLAQVLGGFAFMFYTSWSLSALMLILIPPIALAAVVFGKRIRILSKEFQSALADASIVAEESISGARTVKAFVQEPHETQRYATTLAKALNTAQRRTRSVAVFMSWAMVAGYAAVCVVLWYGGREVILGNLSAGDLTQFLLYLLIVAMGVGSLSSLWGDLMSGIGASQRVFEILERSPVQRGVIDTSPKNANDTLSEVRGELEFRNLSFAYPTRPDVEVLKNVNLEIRPHQVVALVGSSGSGKTTITSLLTRFYEPKMGEILLDGRDLSSLRPAWLRSQIGIVSQEPMLISSTIEDNIRYGDPAASSAQVEAAARAANAWDFISAFPEGMRTLVGEKGIQLSGGQKQRVAIARALLKDPRILILDEATSSLDTASEALVQEALQRLMKDRTTLVIAHRLATIRRADVIFVIDQGSVVQRGSHEELASRLDGLYHHLLQRQFS